MSNEILNRRDFLKAAGAATLATLIPPHLVEASAIDSKEVELLNRTPDEIVPYSAILYSLNEGEQSDKEFINKYLTHLGIQDIHPHDTDSYTITLPSNTLFNNKNIWNEIPAGTIISSNGKSSIYMGMDKKGYPIFATSTYEDPSHQITGCTLLDLKKKYTRNGEVINISLFDAVDFSRGYDLEGGDIIPDFDLFNDLGFDVVAALNINDGSLNIWDVHKEMKINEKRMFCVVGRRLKRNDRLSDDYLNKFSPRLPGSIYDSAVGCQIEPNGMRRRTYTPHIITKFQGTCVVRGFGNLGPDSFTDICMLNQLYQLYQLYMGEKVDVIIPYENKIFSSATLHRVPQGTSDQGILMRVLQLQIANRTGVPIKDPNLSSGCVNMDEDTWGVLKTTLNSAVKNGREVSVMFTTPKPNQFSLIRRGTLSSHFHSEDPFGARSIVWGYNDKKIGRDFGNNYKGRRYSLFPNRH